MNNSEILVNVKKKDLVKEQIQVVVAKTNPMQTMASKLLHSQTQSHVFHLQTKSYAEHKALQGFVTISFAGSFPYLCLCSLT